MKKLLLSTAAVGLVFAATPAMADVDLNLGGYFKGYGVFSDSDEGPAATDETENELDFVRDTELHVSGETVLDNGLTVGAHFEFDVDGTDSGTTVDESYVYMSGSWGRVNFGDEDGAAYLLQVAAPSADSNIDGIRQFVQPVNYDVLIADGAAAIVAPGNTDALDTDGETGAFVTTIGGLDYDQDITNKDTKLTYMTPVFSGFQAGVSYTPDVGAADDLEGVGLDDVDDAFGAAYEFAARYEGQFDQVGFILGFGYSHVELDGNAVIAAAEATDDQTAWNLGLDLDIGPFGIGAVYMEDDHGETSTAGTTTRLVQDEEVFVLGADYTTGPFKIGASYYDSENTGGFDNLDTMRYSGGVTYTYGPGMTFRGSVHYVEHETDSTVNIGGGTDDEVEATSFVLGTQINF